MQCLPCGMGCVVIAVRVGVCVLACVYALVFMLQWGVKLIWEPELLNLLLKLVFDRKLISKASEEEVEEGEKGRGGKKWKWDLCLLRLWLDSALTPLFRLNLFLLDEACYLHPGNDNLCFWRGANQGAIYSTVLTVRQLMVFVFHC